jgi:hypothetical protein
MSAPILATSASPTGQKQARSAPQARAETITNPGDCFSYSGGVLSVIAMATLRSSRSGDARAAVRYLIASRRRSSALTPGLR